MFRWVEGGTNQRGAMHRTYLSVLALAALAVFTPANSKTLCTIVTDAADARVLLEQGDCRTRVTPASTFKVPLAVIGFDSGFLKDTHSPVLPYKEGYVDWGGDNWRQPTDPTRWLKYSVVWYSQLIAHHLGEQKLSDYARKLGFGNADFSGDPGKNNGLDRAWIGSSLKVSPMEQTVFLRKLVTHQLPVSPHAMTQTEKAVDITEAGEGWTVHGKTGSAFLRNAKDGSLDEARGYGWFVGWAVKGDRTLVFARLTQHDKKPAIPSGLAARAELIKEWPALAASLAQ